MSLLSLLGTVETPSWEARVQESSNPDQARLDFIARLIISTFQCKFIKKVISLEDSKIII